MSEKILSSLELLLQSPMLASKKWICQQYDSHVMNDTIQTGGEGGGVFGIKYEYIKNKGDKDGKLTTNKVSSFVPSTIQNLFD